MSKLEVDKITPQSGTTLTIGEAGDTTVVNGLGTLPATIGSATQVLSVNAGATGLVYGTAATDLSNLNATNLTSGTVPDGRFPSVLPAAGGQNLTSLQPAAIVGGTFGAINAQNLTNIPGEISWQSTIITSSSTVTASRGYWINTTSNAVTITLPASASVGDRIILTDYLRTWATNALTINQNSLKFQGNTSPTPVYGTAGQSVDLVYSGATQGWIPNSDDDVTLETPQTYSINVLVVAGGGSSAKGNAGGGGGGGMRTTTYSNISSSTNFTVTVGDGAAGVGAVGQGSNGSDSSIAGSGFTTITSAGGGGAGSGSGQGLAGGSGGGDGYSASAPGGAGNTPSTDPSQGKDGGSGGNGGPAYGGGGGGGGGVSGVAGANGTSSAGGDGGNGTQSSITGTATYYAGGGGGAADNNVDASGAGGSGGGGAGGTGGGGRPDTYCDATANTGGGGGGHYNAPSRGGNGGKGVVILSMPLASFSGTTTGSPTEASSGGNKILTFTGSGSYTS